MYNLLLLEVLMFSKVCVIDLILIIIPHQFYWKGILESCLRICPSVCQSNAIAQKRHVGILSFFNTNIRYDLDMMHIFSKLQYQRWLAILLFGSHLGDHNFA